MGAQSKIPGLELGAGSLGLSHPSHRKAELWDELGSSPLWSSNPSFHPHLKSFPHQFKTQGRVEGPWPWGTR